MHSLQPLGSEMSPTVRLPWDRGIWGRQVSWTALQAAGRTLPSSLSEMRHL